MEPSELSAGPMRFDQGRASPGINTNRKELCEPISWTSSCRRMTRWISPAAGKATTAKGKATVRLILRASLELLSQADLGDYTMRNVAARAGINLKNLQYYFPTRDDLVQGDARLHKPKGTHRTESSLHPESPLTRNTLQVRYRFPPGDQPVTRHATLLGPDLDDFRSDERFFGGVAGGLFPALHRGSV